MMVPLWLDRNYFEFGGNNFVFVFKSTIFIHLFLSFDIYILLLFWQKNGVVDGRDVSMFCFHLQNL